MLSWEMKIINQKSNYLNALKICRERRKINQKKLAEIINLPINQLNRFEKNKASITDITFNKICETLRLTKTEINMFDEITKEM